MCLSNPHISHFVSLAVESHVSRHSLWTVPQEPEHLQGEMRGPLEADPSQWQIRQIGFRDDMLERNDEFNRDSL